MDFEPGTTLVKVFIDMVPGAQVMKVTADNHIGPPTTVEGQRRVQVWMRLVDVAKLKLK